MEPGGLLTVPVVPVGVGFVAIRQSGKQIVQCPNTSHNNGV